VGYPVSESAQDNLFLSPYSRIHSVAVEGESVSEVQTHEFDPRYSYAFDRLWLAGSCPHLLFMRNGRWEYVQELFGQSTGENLQTHILDIPAGVTTVRIAEVEFEETWIRTVQLNGTAVVRDLTLRRGDELDLAVAAGDQLLATGVYLATIRPLRGSAIRNQQRGMLRSYLNRLDLKDQRTASVSQH
jgi:hypothetical protein